MAAIRGSNWNHENHRRILYSVRTETPSCPSNRQPSVQILNYRNGLRDRYSDISGNSGGLSFSGRLPLEDVPNPKTRREPSLHYKSTRFEQIFTPKEISPSKSFQSTRFSSTGRLPVKNRYFRFFIVDCSSHVRKSIKLDSSAVKTNRYKSDCLPRRFSLSQSGGRQVNREHGLCSELPRESGIENKQKEVSKPTNSLPRILRNSVGYSKKKKKQNLFAEQQKSRSKKDPFENNKVRDLELDHRKESCRKAELCFFHGPAGKTSHKTSSTSCQLSSSAPENSEIPFADESSTGMFLVARESSERKTSFITADASDRGWGAHVNGTLFSGLWAKNQILWHINHKELYAVYQAFQAALPQLQERQVIIQSDNKIVVSYIRNQGEHDPVF